MSERIVLLNANYSNHNPENGDIPSNEGRILNFIQDQKKTENEEGATTIVLIDTIWNNRFGEDEHGTGRNEQLAEHLGMRAAFHTRINDAKLNKKGWKAGVGITVATDHDVLGAKILRLGYNEAARSAPVLNLSIGSKALLLSAPYLPEDDPHAQWSQMIDLDRKLNGENTGRKPSGYQMIAGDFNALSSHDKYTGMPRLASSLIHKAARFVEATRNPSDRSYKEKTLVSLDTRKIIPHMRTLGYRDIEAGPTYPAALPVINPDRIFTFGVQKQHVETVGEGLSDHKAIVFDFDLR